MGSKVTPELIESVRAVLGGELQEMEIIRVLHLGKNDVTATINILLDATITNKRHSSPLQITPTHSPSLSSPSCSLRRAGVSDNVEGGSKDNATPESPVSLAIIELSLLAASDWWLVGISDVTGLSTCKGKKIKIGQPVQFSFPSRSNTSASSNKPFGRGRPFSSGSEIVRFSSRVSGEDLWWNPAVQEQAVMRIHRIGQTKNVTICKFIVKGTVEQRMAVQARKQWMISGELTDQEVRSAHIEELKMLFA